MADDEFLFYRQRLPCSWRKIVCTMCEQLNEARLYWSKYLCTIGWFQQQQQNNKDDDYDDDDDDTIVNHKHKIK
jgi:hypothetical protein